MALSADKSRETRQPGRNAYKVKNGVQIYAGSFVGIDVDSGYADLWQDDVDMVFLGVAENNVLGDTSASPVPEVYVNESGLILHNVAVAGAVSIGYNGHLVYASDDDTMTITPSTYVFAVGRIVRWYSSGYCNVALLTPEAYLGISVGLASPTGPTGGVDEG